jgi:hypothetical protein
MEMSSPPAIQPQLGLLGQSRVGKNKEKYFFLLWRFPSYDSVCVEVQKSLQEQEASSYGQGFEDLIVCYSA